MLQCHWCVLGALGIVLSLLSLLFFLLSFSFSFSFFSFFPFRISGQWHEKITVFWLSGAFSAAFFGQKIRIFHPHCAHNALCTMKEQSKERKEFEGRNYELVLSDYNHI